LKLSSGLSPCCSFAANLVGELRHRPKEKSDSGDHDSSQQGNSNAIRMGHHHTSGIIQ